MGHADYLRNGDYNAICDRCGSKFKFSQLKLEWDGLYVCTANGCFENRQPQDYVKGVRDDMSVPVSRPDQPSVFLDTIIAQSQSIASILLKLSLFKVFNIVVSSTTTLITTYISRIRSVKPINGSSINSTTLG